MCASRVLSLTDAWLLLAGRLVHYDGTGWHIERDTAYSLNIWGVRGAGTFLTTISGHIYQAH